MIVNVNFDVLVRVMSRPAQGTRFLTNRATTLRNPRLATSGLELAVAFRVTLTQPAHGPRSSIYNYKHNYDNYDNSFRTNSTFFQLFALRLQLSPSSTTSLLKTSSFEVESLTPSLSTCRPPLPSRHEPPAKVARLLLVPAHPPTLSPHKHLRTKPPLQPPHLQHMVMIGDQVFSVS